LRRQLTAEIAEQFRVFKSTGLPLDHVNGHLHLHLHPVVFSILMEHAKEWGVTHLRWTRDRFWLNARLASGHWFYRFIHAVTYQILSALSLSQFEKRAIKHTKVVFGLLQNERVDEEYLLKLLPRLGPGESEVYSHPSLDQYKNEFEALISPRVLSMIKHLGISLIRYRDL
ncbi:MAG TPA: ChbG/HpnK family deacetylase, partial [Verrucomicrobiae bacterium]